MKSNVFTYELTVPPAAIDELNHVNNVVYLQWCLDAAEAHWLQNTSEDIREKYVWVVLNHFISYKNPSFEGDKLQVDTWIASYDGVKSEREYRIIRPKDGKTIIEAKTLWCFIDAKTHRPLKIPKKIGDLF